MENQADSIAREVLTLSRNTLLVNLRFLDAALSQFQLVPAPVTFSTDSKHLFYGPKHILLRYKQEKETAVRDYLHMVLHCVFRHMFIHTLVDRPLWNLSCDIAVEEVITGLNIPAAAASRQAKQAAVLAELKQHISQITAEKVYRWYQDHPPQNIGTLSELFWGDSHKVWYEPPKIPGMDNKNWYGNDAGNSRLSGLSALMEQIWKDIAHRMQMDLETFSKRQGDRAGSLTQNLKSVNREKYDYTGFLRKFAVRGEVMKLDPDEFDYVFYTYGLKLYENMPLIEPLEYREVKRIREFVIAIDTSGSVAGELVQTFVQKTYNVLKSTESFFSKINIHIIQCDAKIQEDIKITNQEEFDSYLKGMTVKGLGGTDFRPVFAYVDELRRQKEFVNLKGLIYFTDGYGTFPEKKPDYDAAFVFVEDEYNNPVVPPWAIKLVLQKDEV